MTKYPKFKPNCNIFFSDLRLLLSSLQKISTNKKARTTLSKL